ARRGSPPGPGGHGGAARGVPGAGRSSFGRSRGPEPFYPRVKPGIEPPPGEELVPAPAGRGPCGAPPADGTKGLKEPGSPGVGPEPVHWSWPGWPPVVVEPSWQRAKTGAGQPRGALCPGVAGPSFDGSRVGPPPSKLLQPTTR